VSQITYPHYLDDDDVSYIMVAVKELAESRSQAAKQLRSTNSAGAEIAARDAVRASALFDLLRECPRIVLEKPTYTDN